MEICKIYKHISIPLLWLVLLALFGGCTPEDTNSNIQGPLLPAGKNVVLEVRIPGVKMPSTYGMTAAQENYVNELTVLAYKDVGGSEQLQEKIVAIASDITSGGADNVNIKVSLSIPAGDYSRLVVVANADAAVGSLTVNSPLSELSAIEYTHDGKWDTSTPAYIPMTGEVTAAAGTTNGIKIVQGQSKTFSGLSLVRMLARVDIVNGATAVFTLQEVILYNFNKNGLLANDNTKYGASPAQPNLPTTEQKVTSPMACNSVPVILEGEIYVFESSPPSLASIATSPRIVIKGTYNGVDYYYPVDFTYDGTGGTTKGSFMPVVRNHRYIFTISQVTGPGFASAADALASTDVITNITVSAFVIDEDFSDVYYNASDYLAVNAPDFDFSHEAATAASTGNKITVKSTAAWTIQCFEADGTTPAGSWLSVDMSSGSSYTTTEVSVLLTENTVAERIGIIKITSGSFSHVVSVHQKAYQVKWAGSNIYWDGTSSSLTFDDVSTSGPSPHETYQGVYFKWGSLWGISPQGNWSDNSTIVYVPDGSGGYVPNTASSWSSVPYWDPGSISGNRDQKYLTETVHTPANIVNGQGDICKYLTELNGGTLYGKKWRMPTSNEFNSVVPGEESSTYFTPSNSDDYAWEWSGTAGTANVGGTATFPNGVRKSKSIGTPFFPASGSRNDNAGALNDVGTGGCYWSSSPNGTNGCGLDFSSSYVNPSDNGSRAGGLAVRCIAE
ncbi:BACON domain-containing protein [Dysgonomonas sp. GY75]|uniref:BACON domain-containing protein n=1 Tax=Dysgonomonas sp. GY75 TaxID=2780419 RepID=UPI001883A208|nr:BACON domain-containing protein [Dysgonomonas sp. GY75]MBF0647878.1 BACON domain-containing protein [Dysgonomonas sp. GY75]